MKADARMEDLAVVESAAVDRLREWGGDDLVAKMLELFFEHGPERMAQVRAGLDGGSLSEAERGAHSLKSSAGNLGARRLQALAGKMEDLAGAGDGRGATELLPALESTFAQARDVLSRVRASSAE